MEQKRVTKKGTVKSVIKPWAMEITVNCLPDTCVMIGSVVSMVVAPPAEIGANGPNHLRKIGAPSSVMISRMMLANRAMVPNSTPRISVIKMLDRE